MFKCLTIFFKKRCGCFCMKKNEKENNTKKNKEKKEKKVENGMNNLKEKKNKGLLSCFTLQNDEFDIIETNEIQDKFDKIVALQTNSDKIMVNKNENENDFIIAEIDIEKK